MAIKIHNVMTNIVGRTKLERIVGHDVWQKQIEPLLAEVLKGPALKSHKALIGRWIVEYVGNDAHMHEFFTKNWKPAPADEKPDVRSFVATGLGDHETMKKFLGFGSEEDVERHLDSFLAAIGDKKFRNAIRDPKLRDIDKLPRKEQREIALFAPATIYCSEASAFVSLNTNYYGQLKSKSSLGPLEERLIRKAKRDGQGRILNPEEVWISMHAGCVEYKTGKGQWRGIVMIAPTGTGKSTHCYGLVEAKKENRLHSDDWVFVNAGTREVLISEDRFYMRTNIAGIYPHLIPLLVDQPLENVPFTDATIRMLEGFSSPEDLSRGIRDGRVSPEAYKRLVAEMVESNSARSLIDPRLMVKPEKCTEKTVLTDLFLIKRDYDDSLVIQIVTDEKMTEIMTSKGNVFNYTYGQDDPDGYGIPQKNTTEIYYNPYLCICEVDREAGRYGVLDQIRMEAYRSLVRQGGVRAVWMNSRLPASQTQFCLRRFLEGGIDAVRLQKGDAPEPLLEALGLKKNQKPPLEGRRKPDLAGFFDSQGREAEVACFYERDRLVEAAAFLKPGNVLGASSWLAGWCSAAGHASFQSLKPAEFFKRYESLGARVLFEVA